jgi:hypothetical protein
VGEYTWYKIFSLAEFLATDLMLKTYTVELEDRGEQKFHVYRGNMISVRYDDAFMPLELDGRNPYEAIEGGYAVAVDINDDVWFGFEVES